MTRAASLPHEPRPVPGRIGGVLKVLHALIAHASYFAATVAGRVAEPEFAGVAAIFGTYDLLVIRHRVQRGILRALALKRYLLARAASGRNLRFLWKPRADLLPHHRPPPGPPRPPRAAKARETRPDPALLGAGEPGAFRHFTPEDFDADVRRRPVGRTLAYICLDLGVFPCLCDGAFWNQIERVLRRYGGSLGRMYQVRGKREESFQRERDKRPETWHIDWRSMPRPGTRKVLGCLIGEPVPAIVPS